MKKSALIIANWQYEDPLLRGLVSPSKDAEALAGVLGDAEIGAFDVQVLTNQPSYRVCEETEAFFGERDRDDLLLFYFSGHGVTDDDGQLYYAARNTLHKRLRSTAVSASWVNDIMNQCRSRRQVMLLDCCHSGAFARTKSGGAVNTGKYFLGSSPEEGRGKFILTACDAFQYSFEGDTVNGMGANSVFTEALIEGLRSGQADLDGDGLISLDELYDYVFRRVRERTPQQTPRKWASDVEGVVVIATNPRPVETPLPEDLQSAIESFVPDIREKAIPRLEKLLNGKHRGMALTAKKVLQTLASDDSRRVSTAAGRCLAAYQEALAAGRIVERVPTGKMPAAEPAEPESVQAGIASDQVPAEAVATARIAAEVPGAAEPAMPQPAEVVGIESPEAARSMREIAVPSEPALRPMPGAVSGEVPDEVESAAKRITESADRAATALPVPQWGAAERMAAQPAPYASWGAAGGAGREVSTAGGEIARTSFSQPVRGAVTGSKWATPEERAAQLRAFGRALAGTTDEVARPAVRPSAADTLKTPVSPRQWAAIGGAAAVLVAAVLGWFMFAGKGKAPVAQPVSGASTSSVAGQNPPVPTPTADTTKPAEPVSAPQDTAVNSPLDKKKPGADASGPGAASAGPGGKVLTLTTEEANALLVKKTPTVYPPIARAAGITGSVVVEAVISRRGTVESMRVVSGPAMLESAALDAMKSWRYRPYLVNGTPVEFRTTQSFNFTLQK